MLDSFDTLANKWVHSNNSFRSDSDYSMTHSILMNLMDEPSLIGQVFYVAVKPMVDSVYRPMSNVIRVYIPKKTLQSPNNHDLNESSANDSSVDSPFYEDNDEVFRKNQKIAGVKLEVLIPVIVCVALALLITMCIICCCVARKKKCQKSKKQQLKTNRSSVAISAISGPSPTYNPSAAYLPEPINGSLHSYSQTVGLPLDDEMIKTEFFNDHEQHYDEMKLQRHFQQPYYGQVGNDPNEVKWASYWASEHEKNSNDLYNDSNLCPQIPDLPGLPFQNNYGYQISNVPMHASLGSMQSVMSGAISNDRKIRNITMV